MSEILVHSENPQAAVIAIDGPGGAGKGTISRLVAQRLGWWLLDSGALYRVLALAGQWHGVALTDEAELAPLAQRLDVYFEPREGEEAAIWLEGQEVTDRVRSEAFGELASRVAALPAVREGLLARQRAFRAPPGLVADGRDMGTVVFPDAELKIFLTASQEERARRRHKQLKEKGLDVNLSDLLEEVTARDERDRTRPVAPLKPADEAVMVETTSLGIEEVVERVLDLARSRGLTG